MYFKIKTKQIILLTNGFVAQRFEIQSPLIEPNLRRNLGKWST